MKLLSKFFEDLHINFKPTQIIVFGVVFMILLGSLLLMLPFATVEGHQVKFIDALFMSTSAVCVTGLSVYESLSFFTIFGKCIILVLIQIGGLGFITVVTLVFIALGKKITLMERTLIQQSFNLSTTQGMVRFVKKIVVGSLIVELIGVFFLSIAFIPEFGIQHGIAKAVFHSISAFCNAGLSIFDGDSLTDYSGNYIVNITMISLIILGGLGFTVWFDFIEFFKGLRKKEFGFSNGLKRLSLNSKLALTVTIILTLVGWLFFFMVEFNNPLTLGGEKLHTKILSSLFLSVTLRTAGFTTIAQAGLTSSSKFLSIMLMMIGGSPAGTAGGIKTVTTGVIAAAVISVIKGNDSINIYRKNISFDTLQKALSVAIMLLMVSYISSIILSVTERNIPLDIEFIDILFESTSALSTTGLSTGITPYLTWIGKLVIMFCMFLGRLGPVTVAVALTTKRNNSKNLIHYPEEKILVG